MQSTLYVKDNEGNRKIYPVWSVACHTHYSLDEENYPVKTVYSYVQVSCKEGLTVVRSNTHIVFIIIVGIIGIL